MMAWPTRREVWFDGKTLTGCANDLHGPYLGRDGWLYWCKGAFAEQRHTLASGKEFVTRASHIFRARPDGSGLEPVLTGGMDNPVECRLPIHRRADPQLHVFPASRGRPPRRPDPCDLWRRLWQAQRHDPGLTSGPAT